MQGFSLLVVVFLSLSVFMFMYLPKTHNLCKLSYWFHPLNYGWQGVVLTCQPNLKVYDFLVLRNGDDQARYRITEIFVVSIEKRLSKVWVEFERHNKNELPISYNSKYERTRQTPR